MNEEYPEFETIEEYLAIGRAKPLVVSGHYDFQNYIVTDDGKVWSIGSVYYSKPPKWMKQKLDKDGYFQICLNGIGKVRVHRLVLLLFSGIPIPPAIQGLHKKKPRTNNHISNLYWGTHQDNMDDKTKDGTNARGYEHGVVSRAGMKSQAHGSGCSQAKLTEEKVLEIKRRLRDGDSRSLLAKTFGVTYSNIKFIELGLTWKHLKIYAEET